MITLPNDELSEEENFNAISLASPLSIPRNQGVNGHNFAAVKAPEPGVGQQMVKMGQQRAMNSALDFGQTGITSALAPSAPVVASSVEGGAVLGPMAGGGGAAMGVPHVAAALAADELLGLGIRKKVVGFDEGGQVGPLNAQYHAGGNQVYGMGYSIPNPFVSEAELLALYDKMQRLPGTKSATPNLSYEAFKRQQGLRFNQGGQVGPLNAQYHAGGTGYSIPNPNLGQSALLNSYDRYLSGFNEPTGNLPNMAMPFDEFKLILEQQNAIKFNEGGQVPQYNAQGTMTEEQARALMNNQPELMPEPPMRRPINFPSPEEILQQMSAEKPIDSEYIVNDYNSGQEASAGNVYDYSPQATRINPAGIPQSILPQDNVYNPNTAPLAGLDRYQT